MAPVLDRFHPAVRAWFERRFAGPSRAQELGWPVIGDSQKPPGHDVLVCAPTGSGKTLAAFMWAIDRLVTEAERGALRDEVSVLYVSPLKALANDIRLNLEEPLEGVRAAAAERGLRLGTIRAGLRTGDTPVAERTAMLRRPPHILVTTPESLFILLTSPRFREKLRAVRYVIVDELHAVAGNKRGAHLVLTLERLERMIRRGGAPRPTRIGLSATLSPIATLAEFLAGAEVDSGGNRIPRPVRIVRADDQPRRLDLEVIAPGPDLGSLATHPHWEAMYDAIASLIRNHRTTLIFTLSRRWAERIALALQRRIGADAVMAHHGSLARAERVTAEQRLKRGELKAIVATASLELGIDVGAVDLVCQVDSPKSISAAIQRVGRSGHSLGETPKGRFFALTLDDLLECAAAVHAIRHSHLDEVEVPLQCADVIAQQVVAVAAEDEEISEPELLALLRSAYNFADLTSVELQQLLEEMAVPLAERIQGAAPKIFYDRMTRRVRSRRGARLAALTSGGTIPESGNYDVVINSEGRRIGDVEEDFAQESSRGDIFSLGSMPWRILGISKNRLLVEAAPGMAPSLPFWQTEAGGRSPALSAEACEIRRRIAAFISGPQAASADGERAAIHWLMGECALDERSAAQAVAYVRRGLQALGAIPDEKTLVVERFFDGLGGTQIVIHSPLGIKFNRGLGLALRKRLCQSFDFEIQASAIDDAVLIALNSRHSFPLEHLMAMLNSRTARDVLVQALLDAPMFEVRFRHVASRALTVMRSMRGRKVPAWIQRLRTQELITALFPQRNACFENRPNVIDVPDHFLVRETIRECLEESTDSKRLLKFLHGVEEGAIRTLCVDAIAPSVFAHRVLLAWDYSFLDDGERANRRSRTVTMNHAMAEDVFREEDLSALLSAEAVESVAAQVSGRAPASRARNADELHELIRAHGALPIAELAERTSEDAAASIGELTADRRVVHMRLMEAPPGASERVIATEDARLFAAAYPEAGFDPANASVNSIATSGAEGAPEAEEARIEIVRRALATSGPLTVGNLAARLLLPPAAIESCCATLEAKGQIFRGHFVTSLMPSDANSEGVADSLGNAVQWCDRYVLERIHRQTLGRLRAEIEPCADHEFAAFRLRWQAIGGIGAEGSRAEVAEVLDQLSGLAFTPDFWERAILPARISGYRPEYLDLLCMSGEFVWVAEAGDEDDKRGGSAMLSNVAFMRRQLTASSRQCNGELSDPKEQATLDALRAGGAQFLDRVAEQAGLSERDALAALWRLASRGMASNDSFAPLRLLWSDPAAIGALAPAREHGRLTRHDAALRARLKSSLSGRWSAIAAGPTDQWANGEASQGDGAEVDAAKEFARLLLARHGILTREMLALERTPIRWQDLVFVLRRMEYAGTIRRGYFVRALSGEQYALPEALEMLRAQRAGDPASAAPIALNAADPANPYGVLLPGCGIARDPSNLIVLRGGRFMLGLAARALITADQVEDTSFRAGLEALIALKAKLMVETINGIPALESERVGVMAAMRFHSDGRALVYDGLPGPVPRGRDRAAGPFSSRADVTPR